MALVTPETAQNVNHVNKTHKFVTPGMSSAFCQRDQGPHQTHICDSEDGVCDSEDGVCDSEDGV